MTKTYIVQNLLDKDLITAEEAVILLETQQTIQHVPYGPNPYYTGKPDWTYDPHRPGQPWYTTTSTNGDNIK